MDVQFARTARELLVAGGLSVEYHEDDYGHNINPVHIPAATDWLWAGGKQALESWGLPPDLPSSEWEAALPLPHLTWLRSLALTHLEGDYLFVHAGIRPGVSLADQSPDDLLSIRQPFLAFEKDLGRIVVHGHSSLPSAEITTNRIGLDTGAGIGGKLTCAILEDDLVGLLAT